MSDITKAVFDVLVGDANLVALLNTYESLPAIFTTRPTPDGVTFPYIISAGNVDESPDDTKTFEQRVVERDIECYTDATGDASVVEDIAEKVRALFHRQPMTIANFTNIIVSAVIRTNDGEDFYGRVVSVTFLLKV